MLPAEAPPLVVDGATLGCWRFEATPSSSGEGAAPMLVLAHGAGAGARHPTMRRIAGDLAARGVDVLTFNFPYIEAGKRLPGRDREPLHAAWDAALARARETHGDRVWAGGKSMGGRIASIGAADGRLAARGLVYYGYPLHPPGKPDRLRSEHLPAIAAPQLFLAGTRDKLARLDLLRPIVAALPEATLVVLDGADHDFAARKRDPLTRDQLLARAADATAAFVGAGGST